MTWVSILGVAVGVGTLILVMSVMAAFSEDLKRNLLDNSPHMTVHHQKKAVGFSLNQYPVNWFQEKFKTARAIVPFISSEVVLQKGKVTTSASMLGIREQDQDIIPWPVKTGLVQGAFSLKNSVKEGESVRPILLADSVAKAINAKMGDSIKVINPFYDTGDLFLGQSFVSRYIVSGVFFPLASSGTADQNRLVVLSLKNARRFLPEYDSSLEQQNIVSGVTIGFSDPWDVEKYRGSDLSSEDLSAVSWQQSNSSLLFALKLEKYAMTSVLMLIVLVAAFSICGTLIMNSFHRRSQVSILRALGMTQKQIFELFLSHGALIGFVGVFLGLSVSILICLFFYLNSTGQMITGLDLSRLPVKFLPLDYLVICSSAWILTVLSSVMPSLMAARLSPTQGLRGL